MKNAQINEYCRLYEFDPNKNHRNSNVPEYKLFCRFLEQYGCEQCKNYGYNSGKHHIFMIF